MDVDYSSEYSEANINRRRGHVQAQLFALLVNQTKTELILQIGVNITKEERKGNIEITSNVDYS